MLVCLLPLGGAGAEVQRYAIRDLPAVTSPRWEQTYTAYGRTIQVSEEIQIPRVDSAPVLTVRAAPPVADTIAQAVYYHRENYDGSGYLAGKRGSEIPVLAQILAVADYADRHLRWGESTEMVRGKIKERENTRFEPKCAGIMEQILKERSED